MAIWTSNRGLIMQLPRSFGIQELPVIENPGYSGGEFRYLWGMVFLGR